MQGLNRDSHIGKPLGIGGEKERKGRYGDCEADRMAPPLELKEKCTGCGTTADLYGSNCGHLTLCLKCGKSMAETAAPCAECGTPVTRLIKVSCEYNLSLKTPSKKMKLNWTTEPARGETATYLKPFMDITGLIMDIN